MSTTYLRVNKYLSIHSNLWIGVHMLWAHSLTKILKDFAPSLLALCSLLLKELDVCTFKLYSAKTVLREGEPKPESNKSRTLQHSLLLRPFCFSCNKNKCWLCVWQVLCVRTVWKWTVDTSKDTRVFAVRTSFLSKNIANFSKSSRPFSYIVNLFS